jgi:hypothetical protein
MILKAEGSRILADNHHIFPPQTCKSLPSYFAEGWREVNKVNAREELRNRDKIRHRFDVPASTASNLHIPY